MKSRRLHSQPGSSGSVRPLGSVTVAFGKEGIAACGGH